MFPTARAVSVDVAAPAHFYFAQPAYRPFPRRVTVAAPDAHAQRCPPSPTDPASFNGVLCVRPPIFLAPEAQKMAMVGSAQPEIPIPTPPMTPPPEPLDVSAYNGMRCVREPLFVPTVAEKFRIYGIELVPKEERREIFPEPLTPAPRVEEGPEPNRPVVWARGNLEKERLSLVRMEHTALSVVAALGI